MCQFVYSDACRGNFHSWPLLNEGLYVIETSDFEFLSNKWANRLDTYANLHFFQDCGLNI